MKGMNSISCVSQSSTAIIQDQYPSSSSSSDLIKPVSDCLPDTAPRLLDGCSGGGGGGRAIDRHNPIVTDGKRSSITNIGGSTQARKGIPAHGSKRHSKINSSTSSAASIITTTTTSSTGIDTVGTGRRDGSGTAKRLLIDLAKRASSSPSSIMVLNPHRQYDQILQTLSKSKSKCKWVSKKKKKKADSTSTVDVILKGSSSSSTSNRIRSTGLIGRYCSIAKPGVDYISPPESARYLLDNDAHHSHSHSHSATDSHSDEDNIDYHYLNPDPVLKLENKISSPVAVKAAQNQNSKPSSSSTINIVNGISSSSSTSTTSKLPPQQLPSSSSFPARLTSSSGSSSKHQEQVVVLRVSLHCRGCEGKVRKHVSRMQGVRSFSIDFAAKKVTVVGNVTPLGVLASISKVKNAELWSNNPPSPATTVAALAS